MSEGDITPLMEGAHAARELFVSLMNAGFTEWQAINIIAAMFRPAPTEDSPE